ncbi:N,N-dimethylformamidase beta subunit family domain-containing protein [Agromyces arachidis]|uniref:N,N-dimethylformamidase beta subunit family domain-containing protein n=1 Tax=Agromyces arachidis TaxID=766966 RepID=UPI004055A04E
MHARQTPNRSPVANPSGPSRRSVLQAGTALGIAAPIVGGTGLGVGISAASALSGYDPRQRFIQLVGAGNGVIYAIQADGKLLWYRHAAWSTAGTSWASGSGRQIGNGWAGFVTVLGGSNGTLFALKPNGDLLWYRYVVSDWNTGSGYWAGGSGSRIGTGFTIFPRLFGGYDGVIWGVRGNGDLYYYRYLKTDGTAGSGAWTGGKKVGNGWNVMTDLVADASGVIYAMAGSLKWYRYDGSKWASGSGRVIGNGWSDTTQKTALCTGSGALYRLQLDTSTVPDLDDKLLAYRLTTWSNAGTKGGAWYSGSGRQVGSGFTFEATANLQGYATTLDVRQGGTAAVAVSTSFDTYQASVVRLAPGTSPQTVRNAVTLAGGIRTLPSDYRSAGCDWPVSLSFDVPAEWPSGLYSVRLQTGDGLTREVPFTVRPSQPTASIAVLMPTLTYRSYNHWGGHNQYTTGQGGVRRTFTMLSPYGRVPFDANGRLDHLWYSDVTLLRWMSARGIAYDLYEDQDLHVSGDWLDAYQVLVLPTHPEYWTEAMRTKLIQWIEGGGRLLYLGGNGIYERVTYDAAANAVTFRAADGARDEYRRAGLPESQIFGVAYDPSLWGSYAAFKVTQDHPLFAGTGLRAGDTFGAGGYNGPASGWEVDGRLGLGGDAATSEVLAEGQHSKPSSMVFMERPNGGFVFSAGSLTFVGGLDSDSRMSALLENVFDRALVANAQQLEEAPDEIVPKKVKPAPRDKMGREGANP